MRIFFTFIASLMALAMSAQGTATDPQILTEGTHTVPIDEYGYRQIFYFSYTPDEDRLLSVDFPTSNATVVASYSGGDAWQSEFPTYCVGNDQTSTTSFACYAPKGKTIYLKVTVLVLAFPPGTTSAEMTVSSKPCEINYAQDSGHPIECEDGSVVFLPLEVAMEEPYLPIAAYVSYTVEHDGYLYLNFSPSITSVYYRVLPAEEYAYLKAEYITENGKTIGSRAFVEVKKGEMIMFEIKGFNGAMLTTTLENPDPGTSPDFPLPLADAGPVAVPDEPGDYYWSFTSAHEGNVELTSDMPLENGYIEIMMDANHTGSFTINDILWLRTWVYDRIEYLIHLKKENETEGAQFNFEVTEALPCDKRYTAENLVSGKEYTTPDFAGTYFYLITADDNIRDIALNTLAENLDSRTRVNFYEEESPGETLARGLDMRYTMQPGVSYILQWTVFDNRKGIPFNVTIVPKESGVDEVSVPASGWTVNGNHLLLSEKNERVEVYSSDGKTVFSNITTEGTDLILEPGLYIVRIGRNSGKIIIK